MDKKRWMLMGVCKNVGEELILLKEGLRALVELVVLVGIGVNRLGFDALTRYLEIFQSVVIGLFIIQKNNKQEKYLCNSKSN